MTRDYIDETVQFDECKRLGQHFALQYEVMGRQQKESTTSGAQRKQPARPVGKAKLETPSGGSGATGRATQYITPALDDQEFQDLKAAGKCFYCKEMGHNKAQCPKRLAAHIKRLQTEASTAEQTIAALTEAAEPDPENE
ncbi:hypothetical protein C8A00DRAFT_38208 [Chaetomidium leptoderma]|uniref:CCHC-type domain-containing protein n=1 Tax=Chaetomidium leptoderma TaxID=669021 RepID=A0AAN6VFG2_9PEZI|nr:hypothetical protein C8A00DRAFT_38208 [Chaetomidium leptoderma]